MQRSTFELPANVREVRRSTRSSPRTCPIGTRRCPSPVACPSPAPVQGIVWWSARRVSAIGVVSIRCSSSPPPPPRRRPRPRASPASPCPPCHPPRAGISSTGLAHPATPSTSPGSPRTRSSDCCSRSRAASKGCNP